LDSPSRELRLANVAPVDAPLQWNRRLTANLGWNRHEFHAARLPIALNGITSTSATLRLAGIHRGGPTNSLPSIVLERKSAGEFGE
jgi:hypothetical protein